MKVKCGKYGQSKGSKDYDYVTITDCSGVVWRIDSEMNGLQICIPTEEVERGNALVVGCVAKGHVRVEIHDADAWAMFNRKAPQAQGCKK